MSSESQLEEKYDHENFVIKQEALYSPVSLDKNEITETNQKNHDKKDSESLESIQNYAQRIKSFLGWRESSLEDLKLEKDQEVLKKRAVDGCSNQSSSSPSAENDGNDEGEKFPKEKLSCLNVISNSKEECENIAKYKENDKSNLNIIVPDETSNFLVKKTEKAMLDTKIDRKNEHDVISMKENMEIDCENTSFTINISDDKNDDTVGNTNIISDFVDANKDRAESIKSDTLIPESVSSKTSNILISNEDFKMNDFIPDEDIRNKKENIIHSDTNIADSILQEDKRLDESQVFHTHVSSMDSKNDTELNKSILTKTVYPNHELETSENKNRELEQGENETLETENLRTVKKQKEELDSSYISSLKTDIEENNSDIVFDNIEDSTSDVNLSKNTSTEVVFSGSTASISETDSFLERENDTRFKEIDSTENDFRNENNDAVDLRSEDSLDLDETFSLDNNLPKYYVKEIRRLSRDIVKDVIESARSSVHELYTGKFENLDFSSVSENLRNYDNVKDAEEFYFNNKKMQENDLVLANTFSKKKFQNNLEYKTDHTEGAMDKEDTDTICGFGCFKPKWLQKYATPRAYFVLFSIIGVIHGCYYVYVVSILSTLEKRYAFKTKVSGILLLADEITPLVLGILVGYIGGKTHRPRMLALGMFLSAACCFVSGLPYLIYGTTKHATYFDDKYTTGEKFCEGGLNNKHCNSDEQPPTLSVVGIFLFASFLKGFATLSYYVIGISYLDDIIKRKNSPMYFAISLSLRMLGPLLGFLMSSGFLKYYEDPTYDPGFGPDDPRWIGAWWIGFFLQGILLVIFTLPISLFPRRLPSQKKVENIAASDSEDGFKEIFRGLVSALKRLGKNPVFIVLIINTIMKIFGHFGHAIMLPKYMENQFRLSASQASLYSGAITILCIIVSITIGGFLIWKFKPRIKVLLAGMIACETIVCVGYLILMIPRCQPSEMLHFGMNEEGLILDSVCNNNCNCTTSSFTPFCGQDNHTLFFSPCYAGCTEEITSTTFPKKVFSNCSCLPQQQVGETILEGFCPDESCQSQMHIYLTVLFITVSIANLFTVAATIILLRSVHPNDKSVALGTFETFICLFGFIPFPVTFGALVDSACLVWEKSCGETGNCWFYDMGKYGYLLHGVSAFFCALSVVCLTTLYFLSHRVRDLYVDEDEEEKIKYVDVKLDTVQGSVTKL